MKFFKTQNSSSSFSIFVREASARDKKKLYGKALKEATESQINLIKSTGSSKCVA